MPSRRSCSNSCPTIRSRSPRSARSAPAEPVITILTSNRTRELHDALRRRCLYHWIDYPERARERAIIERHAPGVAAEAAERLVDAVAAIRRLPLIKRPGIAEIDRLGARGRSAASRRRALAGRAEALARPDRQGPGGFRRRARGGADLMAAPAIATSTRAPSCWPAFPARLREAGLAVDPGRAATFLARRPRRAACAASPTSSRAGRVTLAGSHDDFPAYRRRLQGVVRRRSAAARSSNRPTRSRRRPPAAAATRERAARYPRRRRRRQGRLRRRHLGRKAFGRLSEADRATLARIRRSLGLLPTFESRNLRAVPARPRIDVARTARAARRTAGETLRLFREDAARQAAPAAAAGRRLRLDEGAFGSDAALRASADPRPPQGRDLLLRHAAVARHAHAETPLAGRGAGPAFRPGLRLRRRHAHRRVAGGFPVGIAPCGAGARRRHAGLFRRAGARRARRRWSTPSAAWRGSAIAWSG